MVPRSNEFLHNHIKCVESVWLRGAQITARASDPNPPHPPTPPAPPCTHSLHPTYIFRVICCRRENAEGKFLVSKEEHTADPSRSASTSGEPAQWQTRYLALRGGSLSVCVPPPPHPPPSTIPSRFHHHQHTHALTPSVSCFLTTPAPQRAPATQFCLEPLIPLAPPR